MRAPPLRSAEFYLLVTQNYLLPPRQVRNGGGLVIVKSAYLVGRGVDPAQLARIGAAQPIANIGFQKQKLKFTGLMCALILG
jgi:hypothetical protein